LTFLASLKTYFDSAYILDKGSLISSDNNTNFLHIDELSQSIQIGLINSIHMKASVASNDVCIYFAHRDNNLLS